MLYLILAYVYVNVTVLQLRGVCLVAGRPSGFL